MYAGGWEIRLGQIWCKEICHSLLLNKHQCPLAAWNINTWQLQNKPAQFMKVHTTKLSRAGHQWWPVRQSTYLSINQSISIV